MSCPKPINLYVGEDPQYISGGQYEAWTYAPNWTAGYGLQIQATGFPDEDDAWISLSTSYGPERVKVSGGCTMRVVLIDDTGNVVAGDETYQVNIYRADDNYESHDPRFVG